MKGIKLCCTDQAYGKSALCWFDMKKWLLSFGADAKLPEPADKRGMKSWQGKCCNIKKDSFMGSLTWWIKIIVTAVLAVLFLSLSIVNLISAYQLINPMEFVMTFFSQSLMLMISLVGVIYSILQLYYYFNKGNAE